MGEILVFLSAALVFCAGFTLSAAAAPPTHRELEFAQVDGHSLKLDLYLPKGVENPPLLVYVHGGAWRSGAKENPPIADLTEQGFAIASVDYRLTPVAPFPANVHDIKAAVRWLRAHGEKYGFNAGRIGILGSSAGGHLAALVGVTNDHETLEGTVGKHDGVSSDVHAIVSFYGASNLETILSQSTEHGLSVRVPALRLLLGGQPDAKRELARSASPVTHVDKNDPPLMLIHGDADPQMPIEQSRELIAAYENADRPAEFLVLTGSVHGGSEFYDVDRLRLVGTFLHKHLQTEKN